MDFTSGFGHLRASVAGAHILTGVLATTVRVVPFRSGAAPQAHAPLDRIDIVSVQSRTNSTALALNSFRFGDSLPASA